MPNINETKFREEYARQVLISVFPEKYKGSIVSDKPDIQQISSSIGVEVTGTLIQRIRYGFAQFSDLYGKPVTSITAKKKSSLLKTKSV